MFITWLILLTWRIDFWSGLVQVFITPVAGRFVRGLLCSEVLFGTAKAGCYTCYRGDCLIQTISVQTDWELVGTIVTWLLC